MDYEAYFMGLTTGISLALLVGIWLGHRDHKEWMAITGRMLNTIDALRYQLMEREHELGDLENEGEEWKQV